MSQHPWEHVQVILADNEWINGIQNTLMTLQVHGNPLGKVHNNKSNEALHCVLKDY